MQSTLSDKKDAVKIITDTFLANPSVNVVIGDKGNKRKKIERLADYAFIKALNRQGAYVSENKMGTALFFKSNVKGANLKELYYEVRFALSIPIKKVFQTLKREAYLKNNRAYTEYYFFWFLGVKDGGGRAGFELKDVLFKKAQDIQLPILLETSVERNVRIYERYGFETYHIWDDEVNGVRLWFMKKDPQTI